MEVRAVNSILHHISLFSGIGGFDIAAQWMGWKNVAHCEIDPFCREILKYYWPDADSHQDIRKTDFTKYYGTIDIISGGFPCQPYSLAGFRKGKEDDRHLWPEMLRAIREVRPRWVVGENVLGIVNWNGGLVFEEVQADLEAEGYQVQPYVLPACAVNAPHRRDRVWFVANSISSRAGSTNREAGDEKRGAGEDWRASIRQVYGEAGPGGATSASSNGHVAHSDIEGSQGRIREGFEKDTKENRKWLDGRTERQGGNGITSNANSQQRPKGRLYQAGPEKTERHLGAFRSRNDWRTWENFPTQSPVCGRDDGLPTELDGITFSKWRNGSLKAYGNAVVPQVVFQIFKAIQIYENTNERASKA